MKGVTARALMITQVLGAGFSVFAVWGPVGEAAWPEGDGCRASLGRSSGTREEEMQTGLVAPSTSLSTDISSPCDFWVVLLAGSRGRGAEQVLCPFCPLLLHKAGLG